MAAGSPELLPLDVHTSCPGKVMVAGGYLVLQEGLPGCVTCTTARFHARMHIDTPARAGAEAPTASTASDGVRIPLVIASPQFHTHWDYHIHVPRHSPRHSPLHIQLAAAAGAAASDDAAGPAPSDAAAFLPRIVPDTTRRNPYAEFAINTALLVADAALAGAGRQLPLELLARTAAGEHGAASSHSIRGVRVHLAADNDFYSQREHLVARGLPVNRASLSSLPAFLPCPLGPAGSAVVAKTGLGSSAALVASLTAAALGFFGVTSLREEDATAAPAPPCRALYSGARARRIVHDCAQVAHGLAQGKVGSGFDVCSAVYGSVRYERIRPDVLERAMEVTEKALTSRDPKQSRDVGAFLLSLSTTDGAAAAGWSFSAEPFGLPPRVGLMLADVAGGSETPGMVKKVLQWRDANVDASADIFAQDKTLESVACPQQQSAMKAAAVVARGPRLWRLQAAYNARVDCIVQQLWTTHRAAADAYDEDVRVCAEKNAAHWRELAATTPERHTIGLLADLYDAFMACRLGLRDMGHAAGVPIEPPEQSTLADACMSVPGVIAAGVPGAGGYDALFVIMLETESGASGSATRDKVEALWLARPGGAITPLLLRDGPGAGTPGAGAVEEGDALFAPGECASY